MFIGLDGETKNTYDLNYEFLKNILNQKLLIRRINLRQVIPIPNTSMYDFGTKIITKNKKFFKIFKRKIQTEIDKPMLKFIVPKDTMLKDVYTETYEGKLTFGRQMGSYPLLVGIPGIYPLNNFYDVKVIDYGFSIDNSYALSIRNKYCFKTKNRSNTRNRWRLPGYYCTGGSTEVRSKPWCSF